MVNVRKGDLVRLEYTGKVESSGAIFDTTDESVAKSAGIYQESSIYGPKLAAFGDGSIMAGMEEAIAQAREIGAVEEFRIPPEKAFGGRRPELMRMVAGKEFEKQGVRPAPGLTVSLDGAVARVKNVASGRVVVDFNHPLSGETLVYSVKVSEVIAEDGRKIEAILGTAGVAGSASPDGKGGFLVKLEHAEGMQERIERAKRAILSAVPKAVFSEE